MADGTVTDTATDPLVRLEHCPCHDVTPKRSTLMRIPGLRDLAIRSMVPRDYFETATARGVEIDRVGDSPVYSFRKGFGRSLVIDAGDGLAVFDTFDAAHARWLVDATAKHLPGRPIRWLVYSHYHLDHTRGGALLGAEAVYAHHKCPGYLADFPAADVAVPNELLDGDATLTFGTVTIECHDLGLSHTDTLYAFHLPQWDVLFTADLGFVRSLPPFGFPDWYYPGYMRALDRVGELPCDVFLPTHGEVGTRADLLAFTSMMRDVRETVEAAADGYGMDVADGAVIRRILRDVYGDLRERYGDWHGFDLMMQPLFFRQIGGAYLGH